MDRRQIIDFWNSQADEYNCWFNLDGDERVEVCLEVANKAIDTFIEYWNCRVERWIEQFQFESSSDRQIVAMLDDLIERTNSCA
jgi:hypothetical protein